MLKITQIILASTIVCFILSCGNSTKVVPNHFLTKRKYNKGWYVNNTSKKQENTKQKHADTLLLPDDTLAFSEVVEEKEIQPELFASNELKTVGYKEYKKSVLQTSTITNKTDASNTIKIEKQKNKTDNKNPENEPKKTNPKALLSFLIFAFWVLLAIVLFTPLGSRGIGILLLLSFYMLVIPLMVLSISALVKWLKCKDCYKNNGLAIPGLLFTGVVLFSLIYLLVEILIDSF